MAYGNGGSAAMGAMVNQNQRATVSLVLDAQDQTLQRLFGAISELEKRLTVVLDSVPPDVATNKALAQTESGQIVERVGRSTSAIDDAASRIERLMNRLQL